MAFAKLFKDVGLSTAKRLVMILGTAEQFTTREMSATLDLAPRAILQMEQQALESLPNSTVLNLLKVYYPLLKSVANRKIAGGIIATEAELLRFVSRDSRRLYKLTPRDFEKVVGEVMKSFGFSVQLTAETRDGGYDLLALKCDLPNITTRFIVECKRYNKSKRIGVQLVRQLYGVKEHLREPNAILVATTEFTKDAKSFAESAMKGDVRTLHLVGFNELTSWLEQTKPFC